MNLASSIIQDIQSWLPSALSLITVNTLSAVFVARSAVAKDRNWFAFFWLSVIATSLVMSIVVAALPTSEEHLPGRRKCPSCAEFVRREAKLCRYCSSQLEALPPLKQSAVAGINPIWLLGLFTIALSMVVIVLALSNLIAGSLWLGLALFATGAAVMFRVPRKKL
ncbi:MAG: hypothetical protein ACKORF_03495 [Micrococcales bacterium]